MPDMGPSIGVDWPAPPHSKRHPICGFEERSLVDSLAIQKWCLLLAHAKATHDCSIEQLKSLETNYERSIP